MGAFFEPKIVSILAALASGWIYVSVAGSAGLTLGVHSVEFLVLMLTLFISQENYQRLFSDLGHLANGGRRLKVFARSTYFLRLQHLLSLAPIGLAVFFLSLSAAIDVPASDHGLNFEIGVLSEGYVFSLILLYWAYCFTNWATLRFLSDTLQSNSSRMTEREYAGRFMAQTGNNVLYLKSENLPALFSYLVLFVVAGIFIWKGDEPKRIALFLGGAATVHLVISSIRFLVISRDTSQKEETERDAIELLIAHMSPVIESLSKLQSTLRALGPHLVRKFLLGFFLMCLLTVILLEKLGVTHILKPFSPHSG